MLTSSSNLSTTKNCFTYKRGNFVSVNTVPFINITKYL